MRIINGGRKDFYDYLVGIFGIDEDITYDRREFMVLRDMPVYEHVGMCFNPQKYYGDKNKQTVRTWRSVNGKFKLDTFLQGQVYHFILEVGFEHFLFQVERYLENDIVKLDYKLIKQFEVREKKGTTPLAIMMVDYINNRMCERVEYRNYGVIKNPILDNTFLSKFFSPEDLYYKIYNYLIHIKEPNIEDKRNDVQKLESKGFDKVTSFRNPINKRTKR